MIFKQSRLYYMILSRYQVSKFGIVKKSEAIASNYSNIY